LRESKPYGEKSKIRLHLVGAHLGRDISDHNNEAAISYSASGDKAAVGGFSIEFGRT